MRIISSSFGGNSFPYMERGNIYTFSYVNISQSPNTEKILNPIIILSGIDEDRRIHGLNIRLLRDPYTFIQKYKEIYFKNNKLNISNDHKWSFKYEVLDALFSKTTPDIKKAWRYYNPYFMKNIKSINIIQVKNYLQMNTKTLKTNVGLL